KATKRVVVFFCVFVFVARRARLTTRAKSISPRGPRSVAPLWQPHSFGELGSSSSVDAPLFADGAGSPASTEPPSRVTGFGAPASGDDTPGSGGRVQLQPSGTG